MMGDPGFGELILRQRIEANEIDRERDQHADAGRGETEMPTDLLAQRAADERGQKRADIDSDVEDRIGAVAAMVAGRIERSDLAGCVRLEQPHADDEYEQRYEEQALECH